MFTIRLKLMIAIFFISSNQNVMAMEWGFNWFLGSGNPLVSVSNYQEEGKEEFKISDEENSAEEIDVEEIGDDEVNFPILIKPEKRKKIDFSVETASLNKNRNNQRLGLTAYTLFNPEDALKQIKLFQDPGYDITLSLSINHITVNYEGKREVNITEGQMPQWISFLSQITTLSHLKIIYKDTNIDAKAINMFNHLKVRDIETLQFTLKDNRKYDNVVLQKLANNLRSILCRNSNLTSIDLKGATLDVGALFKGLAEFPQLTYLDLTKNRMSPLGVEVLGEFLPQSQNLKDITLDMTDFDSGDGYYGRANLDYAPLTKALNAIEPLKKLVINVGSFRENFLTFIEQCSGLEEIYMIGTPDHLELYEKLGEIVSVHPCLKRLSCDGFAESGASALFFQALGEKLSPKSPLSALVLKGWNLGDLGALALASVLREEHNLRHLTLNEVERHNSYSHEMITIIGYKGIATALTRSLKEGNVFTLLGINSKLCTKIDSPFFLLMNKGLLKFS